jgi:hypothetical protein
MAMPKQSELITANTNAMNTPADFLKVLVVFYFGGSGYFFNWKKPYPKLLVQAAVLVG